MRYTQKPATIELRVDGSTATIAGTFPFHNPTIRKGRGEVFMQGAFKNTLSSDNPVHLLFDHDNSKVIGRTGSNLELRETDDGLEFECKVEKDTDISGYKGISLGFEVRNGGEYLSNYGGNTARVLRSVDLFEISLVKNPQYENTKIEVRSKRINKWR